MPIPASTKSDIANSARSHLVGGTKSFASIVDAIMRKFSLTRLTDKAVVSNIIRQQQQAALAAEEAISNPLGTPNVRDLPIDWSAKNIPGRYAYTFRATFFKPNTNEKTSTIIVISSNRLITQSEAEEFAYAEFESIGTTGRSTNPNAAGADIGGLNLTLLSIGRKP